ncbi:putative membrane protein [Mycobacterium sp. URHB0021]
MIVLGIILVILGLILPALLHTTGRAVGRRRHYY